MEASFFVKNCRNARKPKEMRVTSVSGKHADNKDNSGIAKA
jgi:hypothetical protein